MSKPLNQELSSWKVLLDHLRGTETAWRGIPLSGRDHDTYTEAILMGAMVLNDLSKRYEGCGSHGDHVRWAMKMVRVDVGQLASFLSEAIVLWRRLSLDDVRIATRSYAGFKRQLSMVFPFAGDFLSPMKGCITDYMTSPDPLSFRLVYQHLSFLNHLTLLDIDMSDELEANYIEHELKLTQQQLPDGLIAEMNRVMRRWLADFSIDEASFIPKHGPGGVAELKGDTSLVAKYRMISPDPLIKYVFRKYAGVDASSYAPVELDVFTSRKSRTIFVPKSMKTKRTISMEPATLQYFQQGVDACIRKYIKQHPTLSKHIDLNDQSFQQREAIYASSSKTLATVDLSAASDSVSWNLARRVFAGTALLPFLWALRSTSTELPSGKSLELTKFAPMGSALCFPVQTLIFACICECTKRYVHATEGDYLDRYRVYGDDIIVPDRCLYDLTFNLAMCGFTLNQAKTYGGNYRFRESCGCDAYDGVDVTPLRISRWFSAKRITSRTPGAFEALIQLANSANVYQLPLLRRYIIDKLVNDAKRIPLFSEDPNNGVWTPAPSNYLAPRRVNDDYQRSEVRVARVVSCSRPGKNCSQSCFGCGHGDVRLPSHDCDDIRYFERLRSTFNRTPDVLHTEYSSSLRGGGRWIFVRGSDLVEEQRPTSIGSHEERLTDRWVEDPSV